MPPHELDQFNRAAEAIQRATALQQLFTYAGGDRGRAAYASATAVLPELHRRLQDATAAILRHAPAPAGRGYAS